MREDEFERKRDVALDILAKTGMWKYTYRPPLLVFWWYIGVKIPPFLLANSAITIIYLTVPVSIAFGLYFMLASIITGFFPLLFSHVLTAFFLFWILFTIFVLLENAYRRQKYKLPSWSEL
jgi:hypothetical protein